MLAVQATAGDRDAFGALVERHQAAVRRLTRAVTGDAHDADDAAQDAFLSALDRIETYDASRPFGPWLMRIATNASIDLVRRRTVRRPMRWTSGPLARADAGLRRRGGGDPGAAGCGTRGAAGAAAGRRDVVRRGRVFARGDRGGAGDP